MIVTSFGLMILTNTVANILPINGITTGQVSDSYPNLFAPAGITFSIWGLIYFLLAIYVVFQLLQKNVNKDINIYFIASSILNSFWIFAWHYKLIPLTIVLMVALLYCLIKIADIYTKKPLKSKEKLLTKIPFGVYFGWITIATIANATVLLVSIGWKNFILPDQIWMVIILFVGTLISVLRTWKDNNLAYGLVPVWAYFGIWFKHTSSTGFNNQYPLFITTALLCIAFLVVSNIALIYKKRYF